MTHRESQFQAFKKAVIEASSNPDFIHHPWFVKYHLEIVERLAEELLPHYQQADAELVRVMVWLHDYGKAIDFPNQYQTTLTAGRAKLTELGYPPEFVDRAVSYIGTMDQKMTVDLKKAPIEVQIVASADGCSHFVGPFMSLWWWENHGKDFHDLMADTIRKVAKDWDRKITLPEARAAFADRRRLILEQSGQLPERFL